MNIDEAVDIILEKSLYNTDYKWRTFDGHWTRISIPYTTVIYMISDGKIRSHSGIEKWIKHWMRERNGGLFKSR